MSALSVRHGGVLVDVPVDAVVGRGGSVPVFIATLLRACAGGGISAQTWLRSADCRGLLEENVSGRLEAGGSGVGSTVQDGGSKGRCKTETLGAGVAESFGNSVGQEDGCYDSGGDSRRSRQDDARGENSRFVGVDETTGLTSSACSATSAKYVPPARRGPNGGVSVGRGPNYERNQLIRRRRKEARCSQGERYPCEQVRQAVRLPTFDACEQNVRDELQRTRAERLVLENKLRTVKLRQELEVAESRDVQQMIQQQRTQLLRQTELNKVQIEKAHGSLSGEVAGSVPVVPTVVGGTVETVLTGGSISPSSSISEAEIRKLHKDFLDGQARIAKLEKDNYKLRFGVHQDDEEGPGDGAPWDGGEDSMSQDQFSYRSGYMCTPEQREENKKLALELRGW